MTPHPNPREVAREVLTECIRSVTGRDDLPPRAGQQRLMDAVTTAFLHTHDTERAEAGQLLGEAQTGTGKSFAYLVPAMVIAALHGERTVISTEMISLQTQIIDKDAPVVAAAVEKVTGVRPTFALMKGFSNYACLNATIEAVTEMPGLVAPPRSKDAVADLREQVTKRHRHAPDNRLALLEWSLGQCSGEGTGDKNTYPGSLANPALWDSVSVSSADCIGAEKCHFADICRPRAARRRAADADIVVTNHHLLAVQAAKDVPAMLGSKTLGNFEHLVIDEAHGLPSIVRSQGSVEVSSRVIGRAAKSLLRVFGDDDTKAQKVIAEGEGIAARVDEELNEWVARIKRDDDVVRLGPDDDPLEETASLILDWVKAATQMVASARDNTENQTLQLKARRVLNGFGALAGAVNELTDHRPGCARWVKVEQPHSKAKDPGSYPAARFTPVEVAGMLDRNLWHAELVEGEDNHELEPRSYEGEEQDGPKPRLPLTVAAMSATLPRGFSRQIGLKVPTEKYESPFDDAYGSSVLYVARARHGSDDVEALRKPSPGRPKFDTSKHAEWAASHLRDLVEANGGSALVLAATATAGWKYAEALTLASRGRWQVLSQWDGPPLRAQVEAWRRDTGSVLVGTKSLMTGVDAPGVTNTLVVIDRPARARSNPVDDARVEALIENAGTDKWVADRMVYVADASAMLAQSAGRLIRSVNDSGMVAVLDPRLLKSGPFAYPEPTRKEYLAAVQKFDTKLADLGEATQWLRDRRARVARVA